MAGDPHSVLVNYFNAALDFLHIGHHYFDKRVKSSSQIIVKKTRLTLQIPANTKTISQIQSTGKYQMRGRVCILGIVVGVVNLSF